MAKKKKVTTIQPVDTSVPTQVQPVNDLGSVFDQAKIKLQQKRHESIGNLFDKAADVIGGYLDDPNVDSTAKMLPAKLAIDLYTAQEKFQREDERLELEKRKLEMEEKKSALPYLPGGQIINNQTNISVTTPEALAEIKKKQDELLASHRKKTPPKKP